MRSGPCRAGLAALLLAVAAWRTPPAAAEELALLGGVTDTDDHTHATYAWGLEYRQRFLPHLYASFGYLNEGHLPNDHRDGAVLQAWADTGPWRDRFALALGVGPYVYFDTTHEINWQGYSDQHGTALIVTGRASYQLSRQWFALLELSQIAGVSPATRTVMLGAGYRLDSFLAGLDGTASGPGAIADVPNELGVFGGQTVLNNLQSNKSTDFGVEYRFRPARHLELSTSVLEEGDGAVGRHAAVTGEVWAVQEFLGRQLAVGLGLGPYVALSAYYTSDGRPGASVVGLASMTVAWRFAGAAALRFSWHRGFTSDDQDRDIITAGVAWRF